MFINIKILKQLMKEAHKNGLLIGQTEDEIHLSGKSWTADIKKKWMPKQIMAQIIELAGELPDVGKKRLYYRMNGKDHSGDTEEMEKEDREELNAMAVVTDLILIDARETKNRLLQTGQQILVVNNVFVEIADPQSVDAERESSIEGPFLKDYRIVWRTNMAQFSADLKKDMRHNRLLNGLCMLDLTEDPE